MVDFMTATNLDIAVVTLVLSLAATATSMFSLIMTLDLWNRVIKIKKRDKNA
jgi:hypothetical protein